MAVQAISAQIDAPSFTALGARLPLDQCTGDPDDDRLWLADPYASPLFQALHFPGASRWRPPDFPIPTKSGARQRPLPLT